MGYYEYLPHTADVRIKVVGKDLPDLFDFALKGLCGVLTVQSFPEGTKKINEQIELISVDDTALIIDFLSEALLLMYKKKAIFSELKISKLEEHQINAELQGISVDGFAEDIKAVTYHEAEITRNSNNELEVIITLDI
ncbi:MAG: archease [Bacteroidetes bacterium]|nr:MAG: archease [Bacteroidota bacterium]